MQNTHSKLSEREIAEAWAKIIIQLLSTLKKLIIPVQSAPPEKRVCDKLFSL
jgi:hypothetical protein